MTDEGPDAPPPAPQPVPMPYPNTRQPVYGQPPADAYGRPFAAPYTAPPAPGYRPRQPRPAGSRTLGAVAFILSLLAAVVAPIVASFAGWGIGAGVGAQQLSALSETNASTSAMLAALTPVRGEVLVAEIAFWAGMILGIWAIVQGIVAIATRRGRGFGIAAVIVAAIGPFAYFVLLLIFLGLGAAGAVPPNA
ncbi:hypothetical protein [Microbacterium rhizosphaerae]|uniref:DUF4064 domain-containing protein n=1 Tax=Microbacterium rhizosphaerae TaxID=1678237 RepID=A0ABZ0SJ07_9MICO|nr:hypothetical protein [Microbacterium rhizosphaerae]WPR88573.1 hypothetical protein SM116_12420 [Microbacterium rhizosphaerae]